MFYILQTVKFILLEHMYVKHVNLELGVRSKALINAVHSLFQLLVDLFGSHPLLLHDFARFLQIRNQIEHTERVILAQYFDLVLNLLQFFLVALIKTEFIVFELIEVVQGADVTVIASCVIIFNLSDIVTKILSIVTSVVLERDSNFGHFL